jgi:leucyl-tRNA synthetase
MEYQPRVLEPKWQKYWQKNKVYQVKNDTTKPKYYVLDMFPYPSGAGLHVGHPLGYLASDIFSRYKRLKGFNVLHPMGYDSFGLPAEQYAIQTGIHPEIATKNNIKRYREQLDNMGFSFDWSREVRTSSPEYYKWTQWIFMQLYEHYYDLKADKAVYIAKLIKKFEKSGNKSVQAACDEETPIFTAIQWNGMSEKEQQTMLLRYRLTYPADSTVNWCAGLGTVLSNDEVKDGVSERGGYPVERKRMVQWSMRITAYTERLLSGLDTVDWPDSLKEQQKNYIGRSQGASVAFGIKDHPNDKIEVFTTRVDTIYGVTFLVLAPEHELVKQLTVPKQAHEIEAYVRWAASRSDVERMSEAKKVSGAFTGSYAINPFNKKKVPIFIADYVLASYGTGAVMAVPSGDQRDWNFAKHFKLPIITILDGQKDIEIAADATKEGKYINSGIINGLTYAEAMPVLIRWLEKNKVGRGKIQYKLRNAIFGRQRYWGEPVPVYYKDGMPYLIDQKDLPLTLPKVDKYLPTETGEPPLGRAKDWKYKGQYDYELSTMPGWAGSSWYFYRYMDPKNKKAFSGKNAIKYWKSVDLYVGGPEHATGHLLYSRFWNMFLYDLGLVPEAEYAKKLINQGMIQGRSNFVFRARERFFEEYVKIKVLQPFFAEMNPIEVTKSEPEQEYTYDFAFANNDLVIEITSIKQAEKIERIKKAAKADNKRMLVLYSEELIDNINEPEVIAAKIKAALQSTETFFVSSKKPKSEELYVSYNLTQKYSKECFTALHVDVNIVDADFLNLAKAKKSRQFETSNFKLDGDGKFLCTSEVEKMSKSKYNVVNPDDIVATYGADCFRMYEMFLGPIEMAKPWDTKGITGVAAFLRQFWALFFDEKGAFSVSIEKPSAEEMKVLHTCIKKVTEDIERFSMNTCVSHFMTCKNELKRLNSNNRAILEPLVILLAPFAPHISEELWQLLGNQKTVCDAVFPVFDEKYLVSDSIIYPVQINGKHRGNIEIAVGMPQNEIEKLVLAEEFVIRNLDGAAVKKFIVVPGRIINIVI